MHIGTIIKDKRLSLGLTLEQVAQAIGVTRTTVQRWETGYIKSIRSDKIPRLAAVLNVPAEMLHRLNDDDPKLPDSIHTFGSSAQELSSTSITDEAMTPMFLPGDVVWFAPVTGEISQGDILAVRLGTDVIVRFVYPHDDGFLLTTANHTSQPIILNKTTGKAVIVGVGIHANFTIAGKVVFFQRQVG